MKRWSIAVLVLVVLAAVVYGVAVIRRGFSAVDQPSGLERVMARAVRNIGIPRRARKERNPLTADPVVLAEAKERFLERCANCHGNNGNLQSNIGQNLYPKAPDLRLPPHATPGRWRNPLHHQGWGSADRHAGLGKSTH